MTYFSNLPTLLSDHDFQARHADMLAAVRDGRTVKEIAACQDTIRRWIDFELAQVPKMTWRDLYKKYAGQ